MKRFQMTPRAAADLSRIMASADRVSPLAATQIARRLLDLFDLLGRFPAMGSRRRAITDRPVRFISLYRCLVVYRPESVLIEIITILPLAGEAERLLSDGFSDEIDDVALVLQPPLEPSLDGKLATAPHELEKV